MCEYLSNIGMDKRFKAKMLASSIGWENGKAITPSGILEFMGCKYYFYCWRDVANSVEVEFA